MSSVNNNILTNIICFCFALYLFNISVDIPDPDGESFSENLSYNDQESIVEFFVEKILGYTNAFPEYDDIDHEEESHIFYGFHLYFQDDFNTEDDNHLIVKETSNSYHYLFIPAGQPYLEVSSPPPDFNV